MQTMINRANSTQGFACSGTTPNNCAMIGGYASPSRDETEKRYWEFYGLGFMVMVLNVRVDQPYPFFSHQDLNDIRDYDPKNINAMDKLDSTGFGPTPGRKYHYVSPIPAVYP
jgi:hypothetical protein